jgi:hypothetical protein
MKKLNKKGKKRGRNGGENGYQGNNEYEKAMEKELQKLKEFLFFRNSNSKNDEQNKQKNGGIWCCKNKYRL